jgi:acyl-CoA thioesterase I
VRSIRFPVSAAAIAVLICLGGCGSSSQVGAGAVPSVSPAGRPLTYVAIGASESFGIGAADPARDAWPQVFYRIALQRAATLVDLGIPGATVAQALSAELPQAETLHPGLVTVWLNVNDITKGVSPGVYETQLEQLLRGLRSGGAEVLVANTPPLDRFPAVIRCQPYAPAIDGACDRTRRLPLSKVRLALDVYNAEIANAVQATGSVLVDLHAWGEQVAAAGNVARLIGSDGFHPSTYGYQQIAEVFAKAYRQAPRSASG